MYKCHFMTGRSWFGESYRSMLSRRQRRMMILDCEGLVLFLFILGGVEMKNDWF